MEFLSNIDLGGLGTIITAGIAIVGVVFSNKYGRIKTKMGQVVDLLAFAEEALADDRVTKKEVQGILNRIRELLGVEEKK